MVFSLSGAQSATTCIWIAEVKPVSVKYTVFFDEEFRIQVSRIIRVNVDLWKAEVI